jgi:hypothetical protein
VPLSSHSGCNLLRIGTKHIRRDVRHLFFLEHNKGHLLTAFRLFPLTDTHPNTCRLFYSENHELGHKGSFLTVCFRPLFPLTDTH